MKELNIGKTNIDLIQFEKDNNVKLIKDSSNLPMYSEYESVESFKIKMNDLKLKLSALSQYIIKIDSEPYPKILYPLYFITDLKTFNKGKFLYPQFDFNIQPTKGRTEQQFYLALKKRIPEKIFNNVYFEHLENYLPKFPDIALIDVNKDIYIDIEIDEPYSLSSGEPIHYIGSDNSRNFNFLYHNWFVIRFTENQIVKHSSDCIDFIEKVYNSIIFHKNGITTDFNFYFPESQHSWTKEDAVKLSTEQYRLTYLK